MKRPRRRRPIGKWAVWLLGAIVLALFVVYGVPLAERLWTRATSEAVDVNALPLPLGEEQPTLEPEIGREIDETAEPEPPPVAPETESDLDAPPDRADVSAEPPAEAPPPEASVLQEAAPEASGPALITLRFAEESWVEMESHGRKLVVGTQPAGSERSVRAEPPVQVLLGNAPGVDLEYRGKPVNLQRFQRGRVARLILED